MNGRSCLLYVCVASGTFAWYIVVVYMPCIFQFNYVNLIVSSCFCISHITWHDFGLASKSASFICGVCFSHACVCLVPTFMVVARALKGRVPKDPPSSD